MGMTAPHCNALTADNTRCRNPLPAPGKACAAGHVHTVTIDPAKLAEREARIQAQGTQPEQPPFTHEERMRLRALLTDSEVHEWASESDPR